MYSTGPPLSLAGVQAKDRRLVVLEGIGHHGIDLHFAVFAQPSLIAPKPLTDIPNPSLIAPTPH